MNIRVRKSVWVFVLCGSALTVWACRSRDGVPADLAPAETARSTARRGAPAELVWGAWHPVPWDPQVAPVLERAYRLQLQGERESAIAVLNLGLSQLPYATSLLESRGALYAAMGYRRAAARDFEEATRLSPMRARAWCALGRMRQELGLENEALDALERALGLGLDAPDLYLALARTYRDLERRGRSAEHYARAVAATEHPPSELLVEAARLYFEGGEVSQQAIDRALGRLALELPSDPRAEARMWEVHALLRELQSRDAETIASGLAALEVGSEALSQWTRLSLVAVQLDDPETRTELLGGVLSDRGPTGERPPLGTRAPR